MFKSAISFAVITALVVSASPASAADRPSPTVVTGSDRQVLVRGDQVIVTARKPGGITAIGIYHAPDSSSGAQLYQQLRGSGAIGTLAEAPYVECGTGYGGAQFISNSSACSFAYRWSYGSYARPQVYFRDHTPSQWPVKASANAWNAQWGVDVYWTTSCPSYSGGRHCVHVWNAWYNEEWEGYVYMEVNSSGYFVDGAVVVHLNDKEAVAEDNRGTVCHELGHALGLAHHNGNQNSCMFNSGLFGPDPGYPHNDDMSVLAYVIY